MIRNLKLIRRSRSAKKWMTSCHFDAKQKRRRAAATARCLHNNRGLWNLGASKMADNSRPTTHQADLAKLPRSLAPLIERPQWAIWRWTQLANGKWQKPPFMATQPQRHASTKDASTWTDYNTAIAAVQAGHGDGISYILTEADPFAAIDLDHCRHADTCSIDIWAQNFMQASISTYQEVTPSGEGVRIWGLADGAPLNRKFTVSINGKDIAAELFHRTNKALTVTGLTLDPYIRKLTNVDKVLSWAVVWGERRKAAATEATQMNGNGFNGGGSGHSIDQIECFVANGVQDDGNRSNIFHTVVGHYLGCGWGVDQIIEHLAQYSNGIGSRYIAEGRLAKEVERSASKYGVKPAAALPLFEPAPPMADPPADPELEDDPELLPDDPPAAQDPEPQAPQPAPPAQPIQPDNDYDPELDDDDELDEDADPEPQHIAPKPLPDGLAPVLSFDESFLPTALAPWVSDIAERLQCPPDYAAVAAIVTLGSVIGRRVGIKPQAKTDWIEYANLWGMVIGPPGTIKSPAMHETSGPLYRLEAEAARMNEVAREAYKANFSACKLRQKVRETQIKDALKKGKAAPSDTEAEPEEPKELRYRTSDTTYEAIGKLLVDNPTGLLIERDELISLLSHLDREEQTNARSFYMQGWSGKQPYTFDRIGRGHLHIDAVCISILGSTQPSRISTYVRRANLGGAGGDGLLQRFNLMVWPDNPPVWENIDAYPDTDARGRAWDTFNRMSELSETNLCTSGACRGQYDATPFFRFDAAALEEFVHWRRKLELRVRSRELSPALEGHFAKYRTLVPALALINHLADGGEGSVSQSALHRAIAFSVYLESHAHRIYGGADMVEVTAAKAILAHIRCRDLTNGFTARDVHQPQWSKLTDHTWVQAGLSLLVDLNYITPAPLKIGQLGGRPKASYIINPAVFR
jgi:hypothetical protein